MIAKEEAALQYSMGEETEEPVAPSALPAAAVDVVDQLDEQELRAVIDYAQQRQQHLHPTITERIEPGPNEEIVRMEERSGYVEVVKKEPCGEDCADCPHGPYLYHVQEEEHPEGETHLHWVYLGEVQA